MLISCYYMCKYVSFRTRRISGAIWGGQRTSHINYLVHTFVSCGYNDPKTEGLGIQNFTFGSEPL